MKMLRFDDVVSKRVGVGSKVATVAQRAIPSARTIISVTRARTPKMIPQSSILLARDPKWKPRSRIAKDV